MSLKTVCESFRKRGLHHTSKRRHRLQVDEDSYTFSLSGREPAVAAKYLQPPSQVLATRLTQHAANSTMHSHPTALHHLPTTTTLRCLQTRACTSAAYWAMQMVVITWFGKQVTSYKSQVTSLAKFGPCLVTRQLQVTTWFDKPNDGEYSPYSGVVRARFEPARVLDVTASGMTCALKGGISTMRSAFYETKFNALYEYMTWRQCLGFCQADFECTGTFAFGNCKEVDQCECECRPYL